MATRVPTLFDKYTFTEQEDNLSRVFTDLQYKYIQTELTSWQEQKSKIAYNPESANADKEFIIEHEFHRGVCAGLELLLRNSDETKVALVEQLNEQIRTQQTDGE